MIGVDIVKVSRIADIINKFGDKAIQRLFTPYEIFQSAKCRYNKSNYFAKRFAAKEAYIKALGASDGVTFNRLGIKNNTLGKPYLYSDDQKLSNVEVSLSDDGDYAIAMIIIKSAA